MVNLKDISNIYQIYKINIYFHFSIFYHFLMGLKTNIISFI